MLVNSWLLLPVANHFFCWCVCVGGGGGGGGWVVVEG